MSNTSSSIALGVASIVAAVYVGTLLERRRTNRSTTTTSDSRHHRRPKLSAKAHEINSHIQQYQTPARLLGIQVWECTAENNNNNNNNTLSLYAPLALNTNVHKTAFAGSLYSIGVLCSYYLGREWCRSQDLNEYTLVAKSGTIHYKRPVVMQSNSERNTIMIAQSVLPTMEIMEEFRTTLETTGKASVYIGGVIRRTEEENDKVVACDYSIEAMHCLKTGGIVSTEV